MSSALVRQALEFVDQEESTNTKKIKGKKRGKKSPGQAPHPYKTSSRQDDIQVKSTSTEQTVARLLALSKRTSHTDTAVLDKIVSRAQSGKPDLTIPVKSKSEPESILFADETFRTFEKEPFCS